MSRTPRPKGDLKPPLGGRDPVPGTSRRVRKPDVLLGDDFSGVLVPCAPVASWAAGLAVLPWRPGPL